MNAVVPNTTFENNEEALKRVQQIVNLPGRINESKGICIDVIQRDNNHAGALGLLGSIHGKCGEVEPALQLLTKAVEINPKIYGWLLNLACLYRNIGDTSKALYYAKKCLDLTAQEPSVYPENANLHVELSSIYNIIKEYPLVKKHILEALRIDPEFPPAHMALGEFLLLHGDYKNGWKEYGWRNKLEMAKNTLPKMKAAEWNGMAMPESTIMLTADQGFGDFMQYSRFIPRVKEHFKRVIVGWGADLTPMLQGFPGIDEIFENFNEAPPYDICCLISSLPQIFEVTVDNIPPAIPFAGVNAELIERWRQKINPNNSKQLKVGIYWSGRPTHPNNAKRSITLNNLLPLFNIPHAKFFSLQKDFEFKDRKLAEEHTTVLADDIKTFCDTAAAAKNLDVVVTVDSSVAHLCAIHGVNTWVMVPTPNDWRWLLPENGWDENAAWYPGGKVRLIRQKQHNNWSNVFDTISKDLTKMANTMYHR